ncbi:hypothetical protein RHSIM_RhsimUnG0070200 [Rhododendron simsii]|uniref:Protein kinase domain-containing protein n=1 Tax=Rhododendron simsii TaxID=118357 RepID=A0A834FVD9_RHOSS|nr:hypothetical protein RHSIM_RhsimUnG0070200 [Rhododendron simsii]
MFELCGVESDSKYVGVAWIQKWRNHCIDSQNVGDLRRNPGYSNVDVFTYEEMRLATKHFRPDKVLGEGGFGIVYKGVIDESVEASSFFFPSNLRKLLIVDAVEVQYEDDMKKSFFAVIWGKKVVDLKDGGAQGEKLSYVLCGGVAEDRCATEPDYIPRDGRVGATATCASKTGKRGDRACSFVGRVRVGRRRSVENFMNKESRLLWPHSRDIRKAEVSYLGQLSHPNLVKLIGYCCEDEHRLTPEGISTCILEPRLKDATRQVNKIQTSKRMKIALDAARGLAFLHLAERPIIYRDFKTSNVLLDVDFNAKLSDVGLAMDGPMGDQTHISTEVKGTYEYLAPEYIETGQLTTRNDVYGFGVVLLEMLSGRKAMDKSRPSGEHNLVEWARLPFITKKRLLRLLDPRVEGHITPYEAPKATSERRPVRTESEQEAARVPALSIPVNGRSKKYSRDRVSGQAALYQFQTLIVYIVSIHSQLKVQGKKVEEGGGFEVWEWQSAQGDSAGKWSLMCYGLAFREKIRKSGRTLLCILDIGTFLVRCGVGDSIRGDGTSPFVDKYFCLKIIKIDAIRVREQNFEDQLKKAEVSYLGQLSHPNLVKLIGYCCEDDHRLLVYEYMAFGSLEKHLYQRDCATLTWSRTTRRMKIALDAARGLAFLHIEERPTIYRIFKTSNILLDEDFNAKLSDFGLAEDGLCKTQATHKVVLLEMLIGRRAENMSRPRGEPNLVEWARPLLFHKKKLLRVLDPRMEEQYSTRIARVVACVEYQCLSYNPRERPVMAQVVEILETFQTQEESQEDALSSELEGVAV